MRKKRSKYDYSDIEKSTSTAGNNVAVTLSFGRINNFSRDKSEVSSLSKGSTSGDSVKEWTIDKKLKLDALLFGNPDTKAIIYNNFYSRR